MANGSPLARNSSRTVGIVLLLAVIVVAFSNSFGVPFLLDDIATIPANPTITRLWPLSRVLFPPPEIYSAGRPVLNLSFALNYAISGTSVHGYHGVNLAIHLAATLALLGVVYRALRQPRWKGRFDDTAAPLALLVAAVWALHPMQSVSVTYLSQRAESLMGLFYLLTLYGFLRGTEPGQTRWLYLSVLTCALGMATKEVMITAPVLVLLFDVVCVTGSLRESWRQRKSYYVGLAATWIVLGALMLESNLGRRAVGSGQGMSWFDYAKLECGAITTYLRQALFPSRLIFDYGPALPQPTTGQLLVSGSILVLLGAVTVTLLRRGNPMGFLGAAFFLLLAPTSSIVPVAGQPIAENRMYLPLAACVGAIVLGTHAVLPRWKPILVVSGIVALAWLTFQRNRDYGTPLRIWADTTIKQPANMRAAVYYSEALGMVGRKEESLNVLLQSLKFHPDSAELHNNVAVGLYGLGKASEAVGHFQTAIRMKPDYGDAYYNFGCVLYYTGNFQPGLECFLAAVRLKRNAVEPLYFAGLCHLKLGNRAEAVAFFQAVLQLDPNHRDARAQWEALTPKK